MGVPGFFAWLLDKYKNSKIISNNNNNKIDTLYLDANCLIHPQAFKILAHFTELKDRATLEKYMFKRILNYIDYLINITQAEKVYIAVDGVAPMAKMNQQRKRRFMSIKDNKKIEEIKLKHNKKFNNIWNNTCITPGTKFMEDLHNEILKYIKTKKVQIIYSSYHTNGEGEHKILQHIKNKPVNNMIDVIDVIYGLDADLIFLALATNNNNIYLLREASHFNNNNNNNNNNNTNTNTNIKDIIKDVEEELCFVSINELRKCINDQMNMVINNNNNNKDYTNDFIFICYFLGNDFLPHLPSIDIKTDGLDLMITCYANAYDLYQCSMIYYNDNKEIIINKNFLNDFIKNIAKKEDVYFKKILPNYVFRSNKRKCNSSDLYDIDMWEFENMKNIKLDDPIKLSQDDSVLYKFRYYEYYMGVNTYQKELIRDMCSEYLKGLVWVTKYYFENCSSWYWQYPYSHAPFISDLSNFINNILVIDHNMFAIPNKLTKPITPCTQLLAVLPSECYELIPKSYKTLITSPNSPIIDMYPIDFEIDSINKGMRWKCTPFIPTVDISRVLDVIKNYKLTRDEQIRNKILEDFKNY
jgi:5'-3' exonuclease